MSAAESPPSPQKFVRCPGCGQRLGVREQDAGRRARCTQCGQVFRIGRPAVEGASAPTQTSEAPPPEFVTFACSLCETRLTARTADVGRTAACPDCGRRNVIPPPPAPRKKVVPAALSGEQYELWGVLEDPPGCGAQGAFPTLYPVECRLCQTLMYATEEQIDTDLKCPDCGVLTRAKKLPPPKPGGPLPVLAGEEYELDPESAPTPRPAPVFVAVRDAELRDNERAQIAAEGAAGKRLAAAVVRDEPRRDRPRVPLLQGAMRMVVTSEVLLRAVLLSLVLMVVLWLLRGILDAMGPQVFMVLPMFAAGCILGTAWLLSALPLGLAIVTESSEGSDRLDDPPHWLLDIPEAFFVAVSMAVATIPAWAASKLITSVAWQWQLVAAAGVWLLCFPFVLLSALEKNAALAILSPRLAASLVRCAGPWMLFYLLSAALAAAAGYAGYRLLTGPPAAELLLPWVVVVAWLFYARLVGRLAWWLAELMPPIEDAEATGEM